MGEKAVSESTTHQNLTVKSPETSSSFYKRSLPLSCIAFDSERGKELFRLALDEKHMETYFSLSMQFLTQSEPAYCGLGSLCMVLNALAIDPFRKWKGVWRWFDESMLDCCRPLDEIKMNGISLPEFVCLARCNRLKVEALRADQTNKDMFTRHIKKTAASTKQCLVVSYHRQILDQTGTGHFSPIGGYVPQR